METGGTSRVKVHVKTLALGFVAKHTFGGRKTTNITQTNE
ncbi:hypothetical protein GPUN_1637 [Glaciecola punicea ACAM 611]|uniref:Uncharacterized protein n=1 Tax=Glaciecola punicea ACAM 611 TaxID=1121923 RepID=H5TBS7_9ALTE|nr:hypothetical protein GPUN_1637 [Glaciecola punicea ACAM 611]